jgi:galactoside O-acetyltransferase
MQDSLNPGYFTPEELADFGFKYLGKNVAISRAYTSIVGSENIEIDDNSRIDGYCNIIASGPLVIGERVHIHSYCQIGSRGGVMFEGGSALASGCLVYSASDDLSGRHMVGGCVPAAYTSPKVAPVTLRRNAVAFARCTILPGVTFEQGAAACAHSLVSRDVPAWTIVAGAPAEHRINRSRRLLAFDALLREVAEAA